MALATNLSRLYVGMMTLTFRIYLNLIVSTWSAAGNQRSGLAELAAVPHKLMPGPDPPHPDQPPHHPAVVVPPGTTHQMDPEITKVMAISRVANIIGKKHSYCLRQRGIFRQSPRNRGGASRVQDQKFRIKKTRYSLHHRFYPFWIFLGSDAVLDDRLQKRMPGYSSKRVVANIPIHSIVLTQKPVSVQLLK